MSKGELMRMEDGSKMKGSNMQGEATKSVRRRMRTEEAGRPNFLYFEHWLFTWGGATDGRSEWYGPVSGESMGRLHEN